MKYSFDEIAERKDSHCIKWDTCREVFGAEDILPMWIADMDFEVAPFIQEAIMERARHKVYGYGIRDNAYFDAIINWVKRRNNWDVEREWIDFTPGVVSGFSFAIRALTEEGDGVVIMPPTYPPFAAQIKANNRRVVNNPLKLVDGQYEIDFEDLEEKLKDAKAILFCNPHNPSGRVFTREELTRVGEMCCRHGVAIICDEIHSDLVHKGHKHIPMASISDEFCGRCVTLMAPTKTFNIAGLSTSYSIAPNARVRKKLREEYDRYHVDQGNLFGTVTLTASYTEQGEEYLEQLLEYIEGNMKTAVDYFAKSMPEVKAYMPDGTYLLWLDFRGLGLSHCDIKEFLIKEAKVGLNDGKEFGAEGEGFMRMNMATSRKIVERALNQISDAWLKRKAL